MLPIIILIDNDESFVYLIRRYAEQSGYALGHAPSVQAARAMLGQLRPAIVLLNRLLTASDDRSVLAALQAELAEHDIPIVGFSEAVVEAGPAEIDVDYELTLPLLYDDFCTALESLGVERPAHDSGASD